MISVNKALKTILSKAKPLPKEKILTENSLGRILSDNIYAKMNNPPENVSSMDGYAVKHSNLKKLNNKPIKIIGESAAGKPFLKKVNNNEGIRIFTGASVPNEFNTILLQERVTIKDNKIVETNQNYIINQYIRKKGFNFKNKDLIIKKNSFINSRTLSLIISANHKYINVNKKPKIAILSTGNELLKVGNTNKSGIISSNSSLLISMLNSFGAETIDLGIAKDTKASLKKKLININNYNLLITTGGASVGKHDLVKSVLIEQGMKLIFWKVAMRPGKPLIFGKIKNTLVLGLPGNPVSSFISSVIFAKPLINKFLNASNNKKIVKAIITKSLKMNDEREDYLRAKSYYKNNNYYVTPFALQDSSMTFYLSEADCLIIRKPYDKALKKGDEVSIIQLINLNNNNI